MQEKGMLHSGVKDNSTRDFDIAQRPVYQFKLAQVDNDSNSLKE